MFSEYVPVIVIVAVILIKQIKIKALSSDQSTNFCLAFYLSVLFHHVFYIFYIVLICFQEVSGLKVSRRHFTFQSI